MHKLPFDLPRKDTVFSHRVVRTHIQVHSSETIFTAKPFDRCQVSNFTKQSFPDIEYIVPAVVHKSESEP